MNFQEAVAAMRAGNTVRRTSWPKERRHVSYDESDPPRMVVTTGNLGNAPASVAPWAPEAGDTSADNWEHVGTKAPEKTTTVYQDRIAAGDSHEQALQADRIARGVVKPPSSAPKPADKKTDTNDDKKSAPGGGVTAPANPAPQPKEPAASSANKK